MLKIKNKIFSEIDKFFYKKFGSDKSTKFLQNLKEAQIIFSCINKVGNETKIRFVGGCVRKSLCGEAIDDIDLATSLEPEEVKKSLNLQNIKVFDTGISHGTVTAIINKKKFEITTLRKDITTDGRHADVSFTLDWDHDASRRDFTINSIYADIEGRIFDPLNGISDLKNGLIKFIGLPKDRIEEDYLRILRYFRFFICYSKTDHEEDTLKAIKLNINGLNKISNERIFDELRKILETKKIYNLFTNNKSKEIILNIFPQFKYYERLKKIQSLSEKLKKNFDYVLILAILIIDESNNYEYFCHKYKVPNSIKNRLKDISLNIEKLKNKKFYLEDNIKKNIYLLNKGCVVDLLLISISTSNKITNENIEKLISYVNSYKTPKFPVSGNDLKKYGYEDGVKLGKKLKELEEKWINNDFIIEKDFIEGSLNKIKKN